MAHALEVKRVRLQREQAQQALRESEERFRGLYENATIGLYRTTPEGIVLMANPTAVQMLGYNSFEELAARNLEQEGFEPSYSRKEFRERIEKDGIILGLESAWIKRDGSTIYVRESARTIYDKNGKPLYFDGTFEDITQRKLVEDSLRESEARYRARTEDLEALFELSSHLREAKSADDILPAVLHEMRRVFEADGYEITLPDSAGEHLTIALAEGSPVSRVGSVFGRAAGVAGFVMRTREPYVTSDYATDPHRMDSLSHSNMIGPAVFVPLSSENDILGVLMASRQRAKETRLFSQEDVRLLVAIGEIAGNALRRARLFDDVQRQLRRAQAVHDIQRAVTSNYDLQITLSVTLEEAITQLEVDAAAVLLLNPHLNTLDYAAGHGFRGGKITRLNVKMGEDYAGRAALERCVISIPNLHDKSRHFAEAILADDENFVACHAVPLIAKGQVKGVLELFQRTSHDADAEWLGFMETMAGQAAIAIDSAQMFEDLQRSNAELVAAYDATLEGWSHAMDLRDKETEGHSSRVADTTLRLAQALGVRDQELVHIRRGALLHDIGKLGVPDSILLKPDKLTEEEWTIMRFHPTHAYRMLSNISFLRRALDIPYCHHEKWDGTGYPRGLKSEEIPLAARIFAVVDVWDALLSDRPYRRAWTAIQVREYIGAQAGKYFDPQIAEVFLSLIADKQSKRD